MQDSHRDVPYLVLGKRLKYLRQHMQESVAEVSGAIEVDMDNLERIEQGLERPSEDVLMLLINHFSIQDGDAVQLMQLAGYDDYDANWLPAFADSPQPGKPVLIVMAHDMRTQYTDGVHVAANKAGLVLHFTQSTGQPQALPVAHVGMSIEQAEAMLKVLQQAILRARYLSSRPKGLPEPDQGPDIASS